jgi:redox-sensitive bicupin YhaK (pirin superfamily)
MIQVRKGSDRGHFDFGWLDTFHTFSFGRYVDRRWMGWSAMRVLNDDLIAPGQGFGLHPHDNMEIISYIVSGQLAHRDSLGNVRTISPGEIQAMSAGSGLEHSEFNPSSTQRTRLIQTWIRPALTDTVPGYGQKQFPVHDETGKFHLLVSPDGAAGSLRIGQDARMWAGVFPLQIKVAIPAAAGRNIWLQVIGASVQLGEHLLEDGDGAAISGGELPVLTALPRGDIAAHILLFELP